jgi:hypothetical protein
MRNRAYPRDRFFFRSPSSFGQRATATGCSSAFINFFADMRGHIVGYCAFATMRLAKFLAKFCRCKKYFSTRSMVIGDVRPDVSQRRRLCTIANCHAALRVFPVRCAALLFPSRHDYTCTRPKIIPMRIISSWNFFNYGNVCVMAFTSAVRAVAKEMVFEDEQLIFYFRLRRVLLLCFSFLLSKHSRPG